MDDDDFLSGLGEEAGDTYHGDFMRGVRRCKLCLEPGLEPICRPVRPVFQAAAQNVSIHCSPPHIRVWGSHHNPFMAAYTAVLAAGMQLMLSQLRRLLPAPVLPQPGFSFALFHGDRNGSASWPRCWAACRWVGSGPFLNNSIIAL
jgi:hypothetical protein